MRDQLHRLFSTTIRCSYSDEAEGHAAGIGYSIAHKHELWWSPRDPDQRPLWDSVVVLSAEFYEELVGHAVPINLRALKALKGSPLALDIYSWLTYRMSYRRKRCRPMSQRGLVASGMFFSPIRPEDQLRRMP